ncbi:MAG: DUF1573 domain-containing protein [Syntrophobacteraceae bacterium]
MNYRSFNWCISLTLLCLFVICGHPGGVTDCLAQQDRSSSDNPAEGPSMIIAETKFDFGDVDEGSVVSHDFIVKNNGRADLQINKVSPD